MALDALESESIEILREAVAAAERPVLLYSIGKDSSVLLHLARKAFHPAPLPFPLLHVDTGWKFKAMYAHRDRMMRETGASLIVYTNEDGARRGHQSLHPRLQLLHRRDEDRGAQAGPRCARLRRDLRRGAT